MSRMPGHVPEPYPGLGLTGPRHLAAPASPQLCQGWGWGELRGGWDQQSVAHHRCQRKGTRAARPGHPAPALARQTWHRQTLTGGETPWRSLHRQLGHRIRGPTVLLRGPRTGSCSMGIPKNPPPGGHRPPHHPVPATGCCCIYCGHHGGLFATQLPQTMPPWGRAHRSPAAPPDPTAPPRPRNRGMDERGNNYPALGDEAMFANHCESRRRRQLSLSARLIKNKCPLQPG